MRVLTYGTDFFVSDQEKAMKTPIWLSIVLTMCAVVAGCNTIHGAGKDIERGGEKIQEQAR